MNLLECRLPKTHKEIVRIMVFSIPCLKDGQATSNTKARAPLPGFSRVIWDEWGKKGVRMDTKALKKQMGAAIAMVLVAAVALGSATFAWFVSNNKVDATTSKISAQSNSAFMYIRDENEQSKDLRTDDSSVANTPLYPAHWANGADTTPYDTLANSIRHSVPVRLMARRSTILSSLFLLRAPTLPARLPPRLLESMP